MSSTLWRARRRGERPVIYGRDRERAQLRELLDDAIAGHGSLVLISGEAGIGKTTLVDDLIHEAEERDCLVLTGGCYDLTTTPPYGPWAEMLRGYRPGDGDPPLPAWFRNPEELEKVGSQAALFEETASFFASVATGQPLVVVLEDLHWSDDASLEALRHLARHVHASPILMVATYREDEITRRHILYQVLPLVIRESDDSGFRSVISMPARSGLLSSTISSGRG
ncbi:MAG: ATP-binding protein [Thermomicrobiales bacterium]